MGEDRRRAVWLTQVYTRGGWMRHLPTGAIAVLGPLTEGPLTVGQIEAELQSSPFSAAGWQSAAWDPLQSWTDEQLAAHRADPMWGGKPDANASTVNAEEAARRAARVAELDRYSEHLGVAPVRTLADLLEFMLAACLLTRTGPGPDAVLDIVADAPLPAEVLPLSAETQADEDQLRWRHAHEPAAAAIMRLFEPESVQRPARLRTSLQRLARQLDSDPESVRAGALLLVEDGDFTANRDLERLAEHQVFELAVDWERFDRDRMHLRFVRPDSSEE